MRVAEAEKKNATQLLSMTKLEKEILQNMAKRAGSESLQTPPGITYRSSNRSP